MFYKFCQDALNWHEYITKIGAPMEDILVDRRGEVLWITLNRLNDLILTGAKQ